MHGLQLRAIFRLRQICDLARPVRTLSSSSKHSDAVTSSPPLGGSTNGMPKATSTGWPLCSCNYRCKVRNSWLSILPSSCHTIAVSAPLYKTWSIGSAQRSGRKCRALSNPQMKTHAYQVTSHLSVQSPIRRLLSLNAFLYQKTISTSPVKFFVSTRTKNTSMTVVHLDGTEDWIFRGGSVMAWTSNSLFWKPLLHGGLVGICPVNERSKLIFRDYRKPESDWSRLGGCCGSGFAYSS